jgi:uncharacterized Zn finger protein
MTDSEQIRCPHCGSPDWQREEVRANAYYVSLNVRCSNCGTVWPLPTIEARERQAADHTAAALDKVERTNRALAEKLRGKTTDGPAPSP